MRRIAVAALALFWTTCLHAWTEPEGFNGLRWGDGTVQLRSRGTVRFCEQIRPSQRAQGDGRCLEEFRLEEAPAQFLVEAQYFLRDPGGLRWVRVKLEARHFESLRQWLVGRHGDPGFSQRFTVQVQDNSLAGFLDRAIKAQGPGAAPRPPSTVDNEVLEWRGARTAVVALKYGTVTHSLVYLGMADEVDRELERLRQDGLTIPRAAH